VTGGEAVGAVIGAGTLVVAALAVIATVILNAVNRGDDRLSRDIAELRGDVRSIAARLDRLEQPPRRRFSRRP
jgi:hypothetical protein